MSENSFVPMKDLLMAVSAFVENNILPSIKSDVVRLGIGGVLGIMPIIASGKMTTAIENLKAICIADSEGNISVEALRMFLEKAFSVQPSVTMMLSDILELVMPNVALMFKSTTDIKLSFTKKDADEFLKLIQ